MGCSIHLNYTLELWEDFLCLGCSIFQERLEQLVQFIITCTALDWAMKFFENSLRLELFFFFFLPYHILLDQMDSAGCLYFFKCIS